MFEPGMAARLLIVADEELLLHALCRALQKEGYSTTGFTRPAEALAAIREQRFELLISDLAMPEMDGVTLIKQALAIDPDLVAIVITVADSIETAVEAMKSGAFDYILKPVRLNAVLPVLLRALTVRRLRAEKRELEQRIRERTIALEQANRELEAFASSVSHDLRAPLRGIKGFSIILAEDHGPELSPDARALIDDILKSAMEMEVLIQDILQLCRLSRQPLSKAPVQISMLVHEVLNELRRHEPERAVEVQLEPLPDALGDRRLLKQVFTNLLSNAFKFTRGREQPSIQIGCIGDQRENVYFIRDNGEGFDMEYADKLFQPFHRLHRKDEFEGNGVGLAIVQRIVNRHGGRIWAEARRGSGATFLFTLAAGAVN